MATFTGQLISATYDAILKTVDNDPIGAAAKQITDGLGNVTPLYISTTQIGIGITPTEVLHVSGNIKATGTLTIDSDATIDGNISFDSLTGIGIAVTINKFVSQADGIASNDNDSTLPTSAAVKDYVDTGNVGQVTGSGIGGKLPIWTGFGASTALSDSAITEESTRFVLTKDIFINEGIPTLTLSDSNSAGSATLGDIIWQDSTASQRAILSLNTDILAITSKQGGITLGTNSTTALTIDGSQNATFASDLTVSSELVLGGAIDQNGTANNSFTGNLSINNATNPYVSITDSTNSSNITLQALDSSTKLDFNTALNFEYGNSIVQRIESTGVIITGTLRVSDTLIVNKAATAAVEIAQFKVDGTGGTSGNLSYVSILPGSDNFATQLRLHTNNTGNNYQSISNISGGLELATNDGNPMYFKTDSVTRLTISNTGNATFTGTISGVGILSDGSTAVTQSAADASTKVATTAYADAAATAVPIGDYLPLAGGTLTGGLTGTSATFSSNIFMSTNGSVLRNTGGSLQLQSDSSSIILRSNNVTALTLDTSQNATFAGSVGVGVTPSAKLHIQNNTVSEPLALFQTITSGDASVRIEGIGGETYLEIASTHPSSGDTSNSWGIGMDDNTSLSFGWGANNTFNKSQYLVISDTGNSTFAGNVGINTASTAAILTVTGAVADDWAGRFENTSTDGFGVLAKINSTSSGDIILEARTGSTSVFKVTGDSNSTFAGNVGIGYAVQTNIKTYVYDNSADYGLVVQQDGAGIPFQVSSAGNLRMIVANNGNVGISTDSPNANLDILNGTTGASLKLSATATAYWQLQRDSTTGNLNISDDALGNVMSFDQLTGNVGISTDSPDAKLEISDAANDNLRIGTRGGNINIFSVNDSGATAPLRLEASDFQFINGNATFAGTIYASNNNPAYSFASDTNTGMSRTGTHQIGFINQGNTSLTLDALSRATFSTSVGIGVVPSQKLEINGAAKWFGATSTDFSQTGGQIDYYDTGRQFRFNSYKPDSTGAGIVFNTGGTTSYGERMIITSGGDVGIGVAPATGVRLNIAGGVIRNIDTYNNTTANAANLVVSSGGTFERSTSSLKYKTDVRDYDKGLNEVMQLQPKYYKGKDDGDTQFAGLIAEDVHNLGLTEFVQYADDGTPDALAYTHMVALLVKSIQELKAEVDLLKSNKCNCK